MAAVRYLVNDVDEAVTFYTGLLGFELEQQFGPAMAILRLGDLTLWLAGPLASAAKPMPDGKQPLPGGWNRFVIDGGRPAGPRREAARAGVPFRNEVVKGPGGQQILCEDPSGNAIELFQPA